MRKKKELLVIIPAHNEEENIHKVLDQLKEQKIDDIADILVIDDASADGTGKAAKEAHYMPVRNIRRSGYGNSLRLGYRYALRGDYKFVIQLDADGQHDVCNIPVIYERLRTADADGTYPDIVLGSRFVEGSTAFPVSVPKKMAWWLFRFLIRIATGHKITDPTTGLQGLSRRVVIFYSQYNHFDDRYPDANMIMQMLLLGYRLVEVPAVMHPRTEGVSMHSGLRPILYMFRMIYSILAVWVGICIFKRDVGAADEREE